MSKTTELEVDKRQFREYVVAGRWDSVFPLYETNRYYHMTQISKSRGTALHVAVNDGGDSVVQRLVDAIINHELRLGSGESALKQTNEYGITPLHIAAYRGFTSMCKCIIGEKGERKDLIELKNNKGETPLFWAVLARNRETFAYLQQQHVIRNDLNILMDNNQDTILHCAIRREFFHLAILIHHCYPQLFNLRNKDGVTPLEVLATRTSAFQSGSNLSWWKQILCYCLTVERLDPQKELKSYLRKYVALESTEQKEKDQTHISIRFSSPTPQTSLVSENEDKAMAYTLVPPNCATFLQFVYFFLSFIRIGLSGRLGVSGVDLNAIKKIKQKLVRGRQLLDIFMEKPYESYMGNDGANPYDEEEQKEKDDIMQLFPGGRIKDLDQIRMAKGAEPQEDSKEESAAKSDEKETKLVAEAKTDIFEIKDMDELKTKIPSAPSDINSAKEGLLLVAMKNDNIKTESTKKIDNLETAFLVAAKNGIVEIVDEIRTEIKSAVHDITSNMENVLFVAVKNRQPLVVEILKEKLDKKLFDSLILATDNMENTLLHLAAGTGSNHEKTWQIAGAAMQMMWDIKWYQYILGLVPEHFAFRNNKDGKTAGEIFQEQHTDLVKDSSEWMKETSESCSVVAALIAGVSFATASTIPGGTEQGKPTLEGQPAFDMFAITSLVGLCFSVTALVMFLSILTSRKQAEDFRRSLPMKLLFGLSSLFVSIASMLIAFCAGHFFVLKDKYKNIMFPIYVATCLPVTFYAVVQFPLYADLVKAIFKKVPQPSGKGVRL